MTRLRTGRNHWVGHRIFFTSTKSRMNQSNNLLMQKNDDLRVCHLCTMNERMTVNHIILTRCKHKAICKLRHLMNTELYYSLMYPGEHSKRPTLRYYLNEDSDAWLAIDASYLETPQPQLWHKNNIFANAYLVHHVLKFQPLVGGFIHGDAIMRPRILAKRKWTTQSSRPTWVRPNPAIVHDMKSHAITRSSSPNNKNKRKTPSPLRRSARLK